MESGSEVSMKRENGGENEVKMKNNIKPPFRPAQDDTKPLLQDPVTHHYSLLSLTISTHTHTYVLF